MANTNVRSGSELRKRAAKVMRSRTAKYVCPKTGKKVKRVSNSVWESSGGHIYTGGAYAFTTPSGEVLERMLRDYELKRNKEVE